MSGFVTGLRNRDQHQVPFFTGFIGGVARAIRDPRIAGVLRAGPPRMRRWAALAALGPPVARRLPGRARGLLLVEGGQGARGRGHDGHLPSGRLRRIDRQVLSALATAFAISCSASGMASAMRQASETRAEQAMMPNPTRSSCESTVTFRPAPSITGPRG